MICFLLITSVKWAEESRMFGIFYSSKAKVSIVVWTSTSMLTEHLDLIQKKENEEQRLTGLNQLIYTLRSTGNKILGFICVFLQ